MGSDYAMNPPRERMEYHTDLTEEQVMEWVVGAMASDKAVTVSRPNADGKHVVTIHTGEWR